tara:strand:+ start:1246 stop:1851 length:606 start_codon:yes stop_codon:yes gene_type:complete
MISILDTKVCNLSSWFGILNRLNQKFKVLDANNFDINKISKLIFPGVGNFENISKYIYDNKIDKKIHKLILNNVPYLGVCAGMQILLNKSDEALNSKGLGIIQGKVRKINSKKISCPHNGWNNNKGNKKSNLFLNIRNNEDFYFNHSYFCDVDDKKIITRTLSDDEKIITSFEKKNIFGVQFHPEKSHETGVKLLKNFISF